MTDIYSREETELAVFGWVRLSFKKKYIPPEISKLITKFWDDTNYCVLKGNKFEAFLSRKTKLFTHTELVDAAFRLASFKLTLQKTPETKWTLQMIDNKTDKNGFFPSCLVYYEIYCEEIDYYYKDTHIFHTNNDTKTWTDSSLLLSKVNKLPKYKHNIYREKEVTFGVFIQLLSKKYRSKPSSAYFTRYGYNDRYIYLRDPNARFNDYHKKIVMRPHIKYHWIKPKYSNKNNSGFSPSFDHGNWCLKYVKNKYVLDVYLKLLRVHGLIEKLVIRCKFQMVIKGALQTIPEKIIQIHCENLKWIPIGGMCGGCVVDIKILKAFKMTENEISKIDEMYWYVYGIQKKKQRKKKIVKVIINKKPKKVMSSNDDSKIQYNKVKKAKHKPKRRQKVTFKNEIVISENETKEKQTDELSIQKKKERKKTKTNWRFRKRKKVKYLDKKYKKNHK